MNGFIATDKEKVSYGKEYYIDVKKYIKDNYYYEKTDCAGRTLMTDNPSYTLKVNIGLTLVGVISGEFLVSKGGLGYLIVYGGQVFQLDLVMTSVIILAFLAALMYESIVIIEKLVIKYN